MLSLFLSYPTFNLSGSAVGSTFRKYQNPAAPHQPHHCSSGSRHYHLLLYYCKNHLMFSSFLNTLESILSTASRVNLLKHTIILRHSPVQNITLGSLFTQSKRQRRVFVCFCFCFDFYCCCCCLQTMTYKTPCDPAPSSHYFCYLISLIQFLPHTSPCPSSRLLSTHTRGCLYILYLTVK